MRLDLGPLDLEEALAGGPALGRALKLVKEQLRAVPDNGLGYGLLRYLNPADGSAVERSIPSAQIGFNYLGRIAARGRADWGPAEEGAALLSGGDPAMPLLHVLEVNALALEGSDGSGADGATGALRRRCSTRRRCAIWRRAGLRR